MSSKLEKQHYNSRGKQLVSSDCDVPVCEEEGERREVFAVHLFIRRWWRPAVQECSPARAACLPSRVHHRSPGVLAISSPRSRAARSRERQFIMDQRSANRRTWRFQLAKLHDGPHGHRSDAHGVSSSRCCFFSRIGIHSEQ